MVNFLIWGNSILIENSIVSSFQKLHVHGLLLSKHRMKPQPFHLLGSTRHYQLIYLQRKYTTQITCCSLYTYILDIQLFFSFNLNLQMSTKHLKKKAYLQVTSFRAYIGRVYGFIYDISINSNNQSSTILHFLLGYTKGTKLKLTVCIFHKVYF